MRVILGEGLLIVAPEGEAEACALAAWKAARADHVLRVETRPGRGLALHDLGLRAEACREPINVSSRHADPAVRLIGNFAETPFALDGRPYRTVEGFWQGLKFADEAERRRVADLEGLAAKRAGDRQGYGPAVCYEGQTIPVGTFGHWALMERACRAKFSQHAAARSALLGTRARPLVHRMRRDSRTIPGAIMAEIWMRIRDELREQEDEGSPQRHQGHKGKTNPIHE